MVIGEEKAKVLNIVKPNVAHFRELYGNILQENPQVVYKMQQGRLEVSCARPDAYTTKGRPRICLFVHYLLMFSEMVVIEPVPHTS